MVACTGASIEVPHCRERRRGRGRRCIRPSGQFQRLLPSRWAL